MNNPTQLLPTSLIAVEVPKDARDYQTKWIGEKLYLLYYYNSHAVNKVELGQDDFEILGEVTADGMTFDVEPYLSSFQTSKNYINYRNYNLEITDNLSFQFADKEKSFYSLLKSNGLYFVNPLGKKPIIEDYPIDVNYRPHSKEKYNETKYRLGLMKWQEAESKVIKGKLVILKTI